MHLLLTDRLTCPRCGPPFGLVLLASRLGDRVVDEGRLGCPNCRDSFPIEGGFADLRAPPRGDIPPGLVGAPPVQATEDSDRLVALLGVVSGPGTVALVGEPARYASAVTATSDDIHVVGVDADLRAWPEAPGVSRLVAAPGLPFFGSTLRAVAVDGRLGAAWVTEAARCVVPRGRVVVTRATEEAEDVLRTAGLSVLAAEAETVVAARG
ncbi:MAG: Trm112 family protein [Gemmatimonadota bacterium]|nr:Trm112 family protein [Gemmatimonadota bacterium]